MDTSSQESHKPSKFNYDLLPIIGFFGGGVIGLLVGQIWFSVWTAHLKSTGFNPYNHDDWTYGWLGCLLVGGMVCSFLGLVVGFVVSMRAWKANK